MSGTEPASGDRGGGSRGPDGRTLDDWLSPELAAACPVTARSRLREIARVRGSLLGAWAAGIGVGAMLVVLGALVGAFSGSAAVFWTLGGIGAALALGCGLGLARARDRLPDADRVIVNRGPSSPGRALLFAGCIIAAFVAVFGFASGPEVWRDPARLLPLAAALLLLVGLLAAAIVVPAIIMSRAREALRRRALRDPRFRALLERDLVAWSDRPAEQRDAAGGAPYGPL